MLIDKRLEFSDAQALTATAVSTNVVNLGEAGRAVGPGHTMYLVVQVDVALDAANADETYVADLQIDTVENFASPTVLETITLTRGDVAGTRYVRTIPISPETEQFLRMNYTLGGTTPSGTLSVWLTSEEPESWKAYPDAI